MVAETLLEVAAYIRSAAKLQGVLQVDTCETQQIKSVNNVLVEFHKQDRESIHYTLLLSSDSCLKTLRLHDLIKQRVEGRYRWLRSEAIVSKKDVCEKVRIYISVPTPAPPPNYEPDLILPTIFSANLEIGFCAPEALPSAPIKRLTAPQTSTLGCCNSVLVEFTQVDLKDGSFFATINTPTFQVVNSLGQVVEPQVKILSPNRYLINMSIFEPILGTYTVLGGA